jgi:radical SAM superfamily enzyme YgiQ (UPF0313 family)
MRKRTVVFIASMEYDNLGVGYMAAILSSAGYETRTINFYNTKAGILRILKNIDPQIIGFSVIFQYHIDIFIDLIKFLREKGIKAHFTAGGHYASLKYEELFDFIPDLDSIVRFEGEYTMLELTDSIYKGTDWRKIDGLVYKENGTIITNPVRAFEKYLDKFPFPLRSPLKKYALKKKCATIIAGRGCIHNCSFCNARKFYNQPAGFIKRIRKPEMVVKEMEFLYYKKRCSVFLFVDDDFPLKSVREPNWVIKFCNELKRSGLSSKIMWQICCRPDEIDEECFTLMKNHGLFLVFLGIEDGTDAGLKRLNKGMTVEKCLRGISILKKLGIKFDFGFMMFRPSTTFESLNENIDFLKQICGDGYVAATFLKMMPYYETKVEKELIEEGRLKVTRGIRDYDFLEEWMNHFHNYIADCFMEWLRSVEGLENLSHWTRNSFSIYSHYYKDYFLDDVLKLNRKFTRIISESNLFMLDTMKELASMFKSGQYKRDIKILEKYNRRIILRHESYRQRVYRILDELQFYAGVCR